MINYYENVSVRTGVLNKTRSYRRLCVCVKGKNAMTKNWVCAHCQQQHKLMSGLIILNLCIFEKD